jgi:hypothetical protein
MHGGGDTSVKSEECRLVKLVLCAGKRHYRVLKDDSKAWEAGESYED